MSEKLFSKYKVIDVDTHITEPATVWTDRVSSKWGNKVPHIQQIEGRDFWFIGDEPAGPARKQGHKARRLNNKNNGHNKNTRRPRDKKSRINGEGRQKRAA